MPGLPGRGGYVDVPVAQELGDHAVAFLIEPCRNGEQHGDGGGVKEQVELVEFALSCRFTQSTSQTIGCGIFSGLGFVEQLL